MKTKKVCKQTSVKRRIGSALAACLLGTNLLCAQQMITLPQQEDAACRQWVEATLSRMNNKEKVGQMFVYTLSPKFDKDTKKKVQQLAKKYHVGGLLYSEGTVRDQANLTNLAQSKSEIPLLITFDGEWGLSMRLKDTPIFPKNSALGCVPDNQLIEDYGREVAREFREMGVQVNFAPTVDIATNHKNPVIHVRSYGEDPKLVTQKALAYSRGLEIGGVLSVVKHFPGHGDTSTDSHYVLPKVYNDRARLDSVELYPFNQAIKAGVSGVMVGHLQVPALEPDEVTPSSLSRPIVTGLLKEEMGFKGIVFSDAMAMKGVSGIPNATVKALKAGIDMVLVRNDVEALRDEVLAAMESGELTKEEVDAKCRKILTYKYLLGLNIHPQIDVKGLEERINTPAAHELTQKLRFSAVTVLGNYFHTLPLAANERMAILSLGEPAADKPFIDRFNSMATATHFQVSKEHTPAECEELAAKLRDYKRVVVSVTLKDWDAKNYAGFLDSLNLTMPVVYTVFTSYRAMFPLENVLQKASAVVLAHTQEADLQERVADVLFAKAEARGKLPFNLDWVFRIGAGSEVKPGMTAGLQPEDVGMKGYLLHRIDSLARAGLSAGAYPGCQLLVLKGGQTLYNQCYGTYSDKDLRPVTAVSIYDVGGVTKSAATTLAVMKLYDEGRLKLTDTAAQYLPWLRNTDKKNITIRELLLNESGLLPHIRFFREAIDDGTVTGPFTQGFVDEWHYTRMGQYTYACSDFKFKKGLFTTAKDATHTLHVGDDMWLASSFKENIQRSIATSETRVKRFVVSDLDYIVLQQVVEAIAQKPMNEFLATELYTPMGLTHTLFLPLDRYTKSDVVPTAANDYLRRQDMCGYVLDEAASFLGGVAGNAGLFSTAEEVGAIFQLLLNGGEWKGKRYLSEATCRLFTTEKSATGHYGLGFDKPNRVDPKASYCAESAPDTTFGEVGNTGSCAWADPSTGIVYVFLSNRACPNVWNATLTDMKLARKIQDIICQSAQ